LAETALDRFHIGRLERQLIRSQFSRRQGGLRDTVLAVFGGVRHDVIQLVRQDSAHRTAEQSISSKLMAR
jgi:hypothetical protein